MKVSQQPALASRTLPECPAVLQGSSREGWVRWGWGPAAHGWSSISSAGPAKTAAGSPNKTHQRGLGSFFSHQIIFFCPGTVQEQIQSPPCVSHSAPEAVLLKHLPHFSPIPITLKLLGEPWLMQREQQWGVNEHRNPDVFVLLCAAGGVGALPGPRLL